MPTTREPFQSRRRHKLLPAEVRQRLPKLGTTDGQGMSAVAQVKFFGPGRYTFYITEFDGKDMLYGYTVSPLGPDCDEWGYASFEELANMPHPVFRTLQIPAIERDCYWEPRTVRRALEPGS